jgi:hypothetical protein
MARAFIAIVPIVAIDRHEMLCTFFIIQYFSNQHFAKKTFITLSENETIFGNLDYVVFINYFILSGFTSKQKLHFFQAFSEVGP